MDKTRKIVENTLQKYEQNYGANYRKIVKFICIAEVLDKIKNETKNITIESYNIIGELKRIMQSSKGLNKLIRIFEINIMKNGVV